MTTFGANETHQTSEQETINHIKKMEKSKSHRPFFTFTFFFLFILFLYLNEYVQHAVPCGPLCRTFIYTYGRQSTYVTHRLRDLYYRHVYRANWICHTAYTGSREVNIFIDENSWGVFP